jgi:hypothetical protein
MELVMAFACDDARINADGKLDVFGIFNELGAPAFPAAHGRMTVVLVVEWSPDETGEQPLRLDLMDDADELILTIQGHAAVDATDNGLPAQTRMVLPLERVVFPRAGRYRFRLRAGSEVRDALALRVAPIGEVQRIPANGSGYDAAL